MRGKVFQKRQAFGKTGQQFRLPPVRLDCGKNAQTAKTGGGNSREAEPATVSPIILKSARRSRQSMSTASATVSVARASR